MDCYLLIVCRLLLVTSPDSVATEMEGVTRFVLIFILEVAADAGPGDGGGEMAQRSYSTEPRILAVIYWASTR